VGIGAASFVGAIGCASNAAASFGFSGSGAEQVTVPPGVSKPKAEEALWIMIQLSAINTNLQKCTGDELWVLTIGISSEPASLV
jgi:hypothetical protein